MNSIYRKVVQSEKKYNILMLVMLFSVFVFPNQIRRGILGNKIGCVNLVAAIIIIYFIFINIKKINITKLFIFSMGSIYFIATGMFYQSSVLMLFFSYVSCVLPLFLTFINLKDDVFLNFFRRLMTVLNIIIILITIFGVLDFVTGNYIANFFAKIIGGRHLELVQLQDNTKVFRMYSFMGHPLFNTQLYLMFYILNMTYSKYIGKTISKITVSVITLIGISLTASKTGFVLFVICIILIAEYRFKLIYYLSFILSGGIILKSGILNNIFARLTSESLTTGRSEKAVEIAAYNIFPIKFFVGYGTEFTFKYNYYISWASAAFEYPFKAFQLEVGMLNTIIIYLIIAIYPMLKLLKRRHYYLFLAYLIVFIDVNTYNGMALIGDNMLIFVIYVFTLLNLSNYISTYNRDEKNINTVR